MTAALEALVVACEIVIEDGVLDDGYYANGAKRFRAAVSAARNSLTVIPPACATDRYKVTSWHGETGSIFYVVDTHAPEDEQPAVVREYSTRALAVMSRDNLNAGAAS